MRRIVHNILWLFLLLSGGGLSTPLLGQVYPISMYQGQSIQACSGIFTDAGGQYSGYTFNEDYSITFCSDNALQTHIQLYFSTFNVHPSDTLYLYDGDSLNAPLIGAFNNSNSAALQVFQAGMQNPGGCLTLRFVSDNAVNAPGWEAMLSCHTLCQTITAGLDSIMMNRLPDDSGYIDICRGQGLDLAGLGAYPMNNLTYPQADSLSIFVWEFSDGYADTGRVIHRIFNKGGGYDVNLRITDDHGCSSANPIGLRIRVSESPLRRINPLPELCLGDTASLDFGTDWFDHIIIKPTHFKQRASLRYDSLTFIPDGGASGGQCYSASVHFNLFDPGQTVLDSSDILSVQMNAEHSWVGDLKIRLICPTGQSIILKDYIQTGNAHLGQPNTNDCLLPWCVNEASMNPPGSGWTYTWSMNPSLGLMNDYVNSGQMDSTSYLPEQSFTDLAGCPLNGTWTLEVCDYWNYDNGYVFWWGLEIHPDRIPESWEFTVDTDTLQFSGPQFLQQTDSLLLLSPPAPGLHQYNLHLTDAFSCAWDSTFEIRVHPLPVSGLPSDSHFCPGEPLPALQAQDLGTGGAYLWLRNGQTVGNAAALLPTQAGTYVVQLMDSNACLASDTIVLSEALKPLWSVQTTPSTCDLANGTAQFSGDSSLVVSWTGIPPQQGFEALSLPAGWQRFTVGDTQCSYTDSVLIEYIPPPSYSFLQIRDEHCGQEDASIHLNVSGGTPPYHIHWYSDPPQSGPKAQNLSAGKLLFLIDDSLCHILDSLFIQEIPPARAAFSFLPQVAELPEAIYRFRDESDAAVKAWLWDFGDGAGSSTDKNPVHQYHRSDSFLVRLITLDTAGCADTASQKLFVRDYLTFYMPNAFSPNGDGLNEHFGPSFHNLEVESYMMEVFDRWGKRLYYSEDPLGSWNGRMFNQGEPLPSGAYVYRILLKVKHRPLQQFRGSVILF